MLCAYLNEKNHENANEAIINVCFIYISYLFP